MILLKPFKQDTSFRKFLIFLTIYSFIGVSLLLLVGLGEMSALLGKSFCSPINLIWITIAFAVETTLFMYLPWKIWGLNGLQWGIPIWVLIHFLGGGGLFYILYLSFMGLFYYRCFEINRWKIPYITHLLVNLPVVVSGIITCAF